MNKWITSLVGISLILVGVELLAGSILLPLIRPDWQAWQIWPIVVSGIGLMLTLMAFGSIKRRGLGALFIPAAPVLTTGFILMISTFFGRPAIWAALWPLEVLSVAGGFLLAAVFSRNVWLGIPAILVGMNGLVLAFCNLTGLWSAWSVLWSVEPLAVGFVLLLIAAKTSSRAVTIVGLSFCGFALLAFTGMSALFIHNGAMFTIAGSILLLLLGAMLLVGNVFKRAKLPVQMANPANIQAQ